MTCIVAIKDERGLHFGGDTAVLRGWTIYRSGPPKVFARDGILFGSAGDMRTAQVIRHALEIPKPTEGEDDEHYISVTLVDAMREALSAAGALEKKNETEKSAGDNDFLIGYRGELYTITGNYSVMRLPGDYAAIGSGVEVALGALFVTGQHPALDRAPSTALRLMLALEAAEEYAWGVRRPFTFVSQPAEGEHG